MNGNIPSVTVGSFALLLRLVDGDFSSHVLCDIITSLIGNFLRYLLIGTVEHSVLSTPLGTLTQDFLDEFLLADILAFFAGNIGADFVRHILTLFFRNILKYFHGPINTVHAGSIYTQTFLATR